METIHSYKLPHIWRRGITVANERENKKFCVVLVDRMPEKIQLQVRLAGRGCRAEITVAHIGKKAQETNMDITLIHDAPDTYGRVVVKSALFDQSKFVFRGMLEITENGKGSDSYLLAKALMVSPQARAEIYPYLEIKTDEVRASHGSSVGKIDPGQLFYLASRGVSKLEAEKVILAGFFGDSNEFLPAALSSTNG